MSAVAKVIEISASSTKSIEDAVETGIRRASEERRVFIKTSGESSDIVSKEMFEVQLGGEGDLVLRPEATPAIARAFLNAGLHKAPRPQRFYAYEPMFRGQRPQKLRFRQFWQWDIECFGADEAAVDVEIIEFAHGLMSELGLTGFEIQTAATSTGASTYTV